MVGVISVGQNANSLSVECDPVGMAGRGEFMNQYRHTSLMDINVYIVLC